MYIISIITFLMNFIIRNINKPYIRNDNIYQKRIPHLDEFSPSLFDKNSFTTFKTEILGDGVKLDTNIFYLNNGHKVIANTIYVDLNKASIRTNYSPTKSVVYQSILDFNNKNKGSNQVLAGINADFFGLTCVNAYIKDNIIIKDSHNDNNCYDYKDLNADIPASKPMLFGVSNNHSRIGPIVENKTIEETIKSKFTYKLQYSRKNKIIHDIEASFSMSLIQETNKLITDYTLITKEVDGGVSTEKGDVCYIIKISKNQIFDNSGQVLNIIDSIGEPIFTDDTANGYYYLFKKSSIKEVLQLNDYITYIISNEDKKWNGYTDIIGGRQSLVENGEIAKTVTLENSNEAQKTDVPRTCIGINEKYEVVITAIEGLRYREKSNSSNDSYGVNLSELAEYMRYIGCYDAINFDGGGSTQLVVANSDKKEGFELRVRSSDFGSYNLNECRIVYNTLLVTTK